MIALGRTFHPAWAVSMCFVRQVICGAVGLVFAPFDFIGNSFKKPGLVKIKLSKPAGPPQQLQLPNNILRQIFQNRVLAPEITVCKAYRRNKAKRICLALRIKGVDLSLDLSMKFLFCKFF